MIRSMANRNNIYGRGIGKTEVVYSLICYVLDRKFFFPGSGPGWPWRGVVA